MANMASIEAFLQDLSLEQYIPIFQENGITVQNVTSLTDQDLKDMGITVLGHRKTIIQALAPAPTAAPQPTVSSSPRAAMGPMPPTYLWQAIVVTLFCCLPFGIVAIIYSTGVTSAYNSGNYELALSKSKTASLWVNLGAGIWFVGFILWFFWWMFLTMAML